MKFLISFFTIFPVIAFAGGSRVGTLGSAFFASADSTGGGGYLENNRDFVKIMRFEQSGKVHFQYKGFDSSKVEMHAIDVNDFEQNYLDALKKSQQSKNWEPVVVEGLVK